MVNTEIQKLTPEHMSYLLHMVTIATRRRFDGDEGSIWLHLLEEYSYDECHEAFTEYLKNRSTEYLTPGLIAAIIKGKRRGRWVKAGDSVEAPNGLTGKEYLKWLHARQREVMKPPVAPDPPAAKGAVSAGKTALPAIEA